MSFHVSTIAAAAAPAEIEYHLIRRRKLNNVGLQEAAAGAAQSFRIQCGGRGADSQGRIDQSQGYLMIVMANYNHIPTL